jgi:hypothetical protein
MPIRDWIAWNPTSSSPTAIRIKLKIVSFDMQSPRWKEPYSREPVPAAAGRPAPVLEAIPYSTRAWRFSIIIDLKMDSIVIASRLLRRFLPHAGTPADSGPWQDPNPA